MQGREHRRPTRLEFASKNRVSIYQANGIGRSLIIFVVLVFETWTSR